MLQEILSDALAGTLSYGSDEKTVYRKQGEVYAVKELLNAITYITNDRPEEDGYEWNGDDWLNYFRRKNEKA